MYIIPPAQRARRTAHPGRRNDERAPPVTSRPPSVSPRSQALLPQANTAAVRHQFYTERGYETTAPHQSTFRVIPPPPDAEVLPPVVLSRVRTRSHARTHTQPTRIPVAAAFVSSRQIRRSYLFVFRRCRRAPFT